MKFLRDDLILLSLLICLLVTEQCAVEGLFCPCGDKSFLCTLSSMTWIMRFSTLAGGNRSDSLPGESARYHSVCSLGWFPPSHGSFFTHIQWADGRWGVTSAIPVGLSSHFLSLCFGLSLQLCPLWSPVPYNSSPCTSMHFQLFSWFRPLRRLWRLPDSQGAISWGSGRVHTWFSQPSFIVSQ